jgi:hypothetical protein
MTRSEQYFIIKNKYKNVSKHVYFLNHCGIIKIDKRLAVAMQISNTERSDRNV